MLLWLCFFCYVLMPPLTSILSPRGEEEEIGGYPFSQEERKKK